MADSVFEQMTAPELAGAMQELGFRAEVADGEDGDQIIRSATSGHGFLVLLYRMRGETGYSSAQCLTWLTGSRVSAQTINDWNIDKRFTTALIDRDGDPVLQLDFMLHGVTKSYLRRCFGLWDASLDVFMQTIAAHGR
jgi:hypothetical protein